MRYIAELSDKMIASLDQTKIYHLRPRHEDTNEPVVCGTMEYGKWMSIVSIEIRELICDECNTHLDPTDIEKIHIGENVPQRELTR